MKKYKVILHPDAELDIESSFKWGLSCLGRRKCKIVGAETTTDSYETALINAVGLLDRARERTTGSSSSAVDRRTLSRAFYD